MSWIDLELRLGQWTRRRCVDNMFASPPLFVERMNWPLWMVEVMSPLGAL